MSEDGDAERGTPVTSHWQHHREPRTFAGKSGEDVDEWITHYERVSRYNRWDPTVKLANVVFFLEATALIWYDNHEESFTNWDRFIDEIRKCFGDASAKKKLAEQTLLQRAQVPGETCTTYIEDVVKLCKLVNPRMAEEDKVGHLLKGIAEDVYTFLISKDSLDSTADVIRHCRTFEALKLRRITPKFGRLANVTSVASVDATATVSMADMIRQIVREELLRHEDPVRRAGGAHDGCALQAAPVTPSASWVPASGVPGLESRRDHDQGFAHQPMSRAATYIGELVHQRRSPEYSQSTDHIRENSYADHWRPPPVCYSCGMTGHISRYCRRRGSRPRDNRLWRNTTRPTRRFNIEEQQPTPTSSWSPYQPELRRNFSPASDRSLTPPSSRQQRSPSPRRRSPPPGN